MNTLRYSLMTQVAKLIEGVEILLASPLIQSRITAATVARSNLIRQLFWAEQMLAALRDDADYHNFMGNLDSAGDASTEALHNLRDFHS